MRFLKRIFDFSDKRKVIYDICKLHGIKNYTINVDGSIDVNGDVILRSYRLKEDLSKIPLKFRNVTGNFDCSRNRLTSLEGAPLSVGGDFDCSRNKLTSLKYSPLSVGGDFDCSYNDIRSFEYVPNFIVYFKCDYNPVTWIYNLFYKEKNAPRYIKYINEYYDFIQGDRIILSRLNEFLIDIGKPVLSLESQLIKNLTKYYNIVE